MQNGPIVLEANSLESLHGVGEALLGTGRIGLLAFSNF